MFLEQKNSCCIKEVTIFFSQQFHFGVRCLHMMTHESYLHDESMEFEIIFGIVRSKPLDSDTKLVFYHVTKIWENETHIRFMFK